MEDIREIYAVVTDVDWEGAIDVELFLSYEKAKEAYEEKDFGDGTYIIRYINEDGCFKEDKGGSLKSKFRRR